MANFSPKPAIEIIERERVTSITGVGWMVREILANKGDVSSVQIFAHGGAPSAKELASEMVARNPESFGSNGYGLTETNGAVCAATADDYHAKPTSVGYPAAGAEVIVVDMETGVRLPPGERGELWVKMPGRAKVRRRGGRW